MFCRLADFLAVYEQLTADTLRVLEKLSDANLDQPVADGHRTLGQIAWHLAMTIPEMMNLTGLTLSAVDHQAPPPKVAADIRSAYRSASAELREAIKDQWDDQSLLKTDDMYGEIWTRGMTLTALIQHEVHHRGQLTVLLRQAGESVPGIYGPAKEEWVQYGKSAPLY